MNNFFRIKIKIPHMHSVWLNLSGIDKRISFTQKPFIRV